MSAGTKKHVRLMAMSVAAALLMALWAPPAAAASAPVQAAWSWGDNAAGQLGDGTPEGRTVPAAVPGMGDVDAVAAGRSHTLALGRDGRVWAWGVNRYGQLGDGSTDNRAAPAAVPGLSGVVAIAVGDHHSLALHGDGTVWAWGMNLDGRLGDGTTVTRHLPVRVAGLSGVVAIAASGMESFAVRDDGTVWMWGWAYANAPADGTPSRYLPEAVRGLSDVVAVAASPTHRLVLGSDGIVRAWGLNNYGQLGDGTIDSRSAPKAVLGLGGVVAIAAGAYHSLALDGEGRAWAWGGNASGQLGDSTTETRLTPVAVRHGRSLVAIAAGDHHSLGLDDEGKAWAWGGNASGQLGNGTTGNRWAPALVTELDGITAVTAGSVHSLALRTGPPVAPGVPTRVTATAQDAGARVSWTAPPDGGSPISAYTVRVWPGGSSQTVSGDATSAEIRGLSNGRWYQFSVRAHNDAGGGPESASSAPVVHATVPGAPTNVVATHGLFCCSDWRPTGPTVKVSWTPPAFDGGSAVSGYRITREPGAVTTDVPGGVTSWPVTGLEYGATYTFTVTAVNVRGDGPASSRSAAVTPRSLPAAPTAVKATAGAESATVEWSAPPDGGWPVNAYQVQVSPMGGSDWRIVDVDATATSTTITGLRSGTTYVFQVRARNAGGALHFGPWAASNPVTPTAPVTVPAAPTGVAAVAGVEAATVRWAAPQSDGGAPITHYQVVASPGGRAVTAAAAARQATVTGLTAGIEHTFTVTAINTAGDGPPSTTSNAVKPSPPAVAGLSRSVRFDTLTTATPKPRVALAWTNQGTPQAIKVTWSDGSTSRSVTLTPAPSAYTITGLTPGKAYTFQVRAVAGGVDSAPATASTHGSVMTAAVTPAVVTSGASTTVSGRLLRAGTSTGLGGQAVHLQVRTQNASNVWSAWSNVAAVVHTTSTGSYAIPHRTPRNAQYRVVFPGAGSHLGSVSPARAVNVAPRITATLSTTSMRLGSTARLTGAVSPNLAGRLVSLQSKVDGRWVDVRGASMPLTSTGTYGFMIKPAKRGTYSYRVRTPASAPYAQGFGASRTLTVT